ncbi:hypothetical protein [Pseudomonas mandelii]|uniref:hypothetical protein n=1 Tax=Pseudomonas mandelii TaxID=75612 RepID=UPI00224AEA01|nr:hypothetical protein [Pseudomonas mandelii]MCX2900552.1 hypothetical protein [Pseudomonas mandelii]
MIDVKTMRKNCWIIFFGVAFFGFFGPWNLRGFWFFYLAFVCLHLIWTVYITYVCERYVLFLTSYTLPIALVFSYMASSAMHYWISSSFETIWSRGSALWVAPFTLACVVLAVIFFSKSSSFPFEVIGNRVTVKGKLSRHSSYNGGLAGGISTFLGSVLLNVASDYASGLIIVCGCTAISIYILFMGRHVIRGLRTLHNLERAMPTPFTFMQIDEIREARSQWWLGRLFKWIASQHKQPSA